MKEIDCAKKLKSTTPLPSLVIKQTSNNSQKDQGQYNGQSNHGFVVAVAVVANIRRVVDVNVHISADVIPPQSTEF